MDAENTNLNASGMCLFVKLAMFNDAQTTGESIWIQLGWISINKMNN